MMYRGPTTSPVRLKPSSHCLSRIRPLQISHISYTGQARAQKTQIKSTTSGESPPAVETKHVSGSFIFKIPNGDNTKAKVALFRRSSKVHAYPNKLGPCAGKVEDQDASPLAAALREIQEETTLTISSLGLLRIGKPYSFFDTSLTREWVINSFAFRLRDKAEGGDAKGEEGIMLDWENVGIEWFDPMQVSGSDEFGGVPRLVTSLARVWPEYDLGLEAGGVLNRGLDRLRDDDANDVENLTATTPLILRDIIARISHVHPVDEDWWAKIRMAAWHICQVRLSIDLSITDAIADSLDAIHSIYIRDISAAAKIKQITEALNKQTAATESGVRPSQDGDRRLREYFNGL